LAKTPGYHLGWLYLGEAHYRDGNFRQALEAYEHYLHTPRGPDDRGDWCFILAMTYWQNGDRETALQWYRETVEWARSREPDYYFLGAWDEAARLLGVKEQPRPDIPTPLPKKPT
jgi:tetratricopeptide (TPR) repeat protein